MGCVWPRMTWPRGFLQTFLPLSGHSQLQQELVPFRSSPGCSRLSHGLSLVPEFIDHRGKAWAERAARSATAVGCSTRAWQHPTACQNWQLLLISPHDVLFHSIFFLFPWIFFFHCRTSRDRRSTPVSFESLQQQHIGSLLGHRNYCYWESGGFVTWVKGSNKKSVINQDLALWKTATGLFFKMQLKEINLKDMSHHFEMCIKQVK